MLVTAVILLLLSLSLSSASHSLLRTACFSSPDVFSCEELSISFFVCGGE